MGGKKEGKKKNWKRNRRTSIRIFNDQIKVVLWNCDGWKNKQAEMNNRLREKEIGVCIITETKTNKDDVKIRGYDFVIKNRDWGKGRGGGVMIGIRKGIKWERITGKQLGIGNRENRKNRDKN